MSTPETTPVPEPVAEPKPSSSAALRSVVVFWGTVALVQFAVFCLFRKYPRFKKIYNVRDCVEKLKCELAAKEMGSKWNPVSWIPVVLKATEDEIFAQVGLDGLCYLRTIKVGIKLSLLGCFIGIFSIPTYYTSPKHDDKELQNATAFDVNQNHFISEGTLFQEVPRSNFNVTDTLDRMSMGNTYMGDPRMATSVLSAYLISIYAMWLLRKEFNWYIIQ
eukprot:574107-Rhodomonas_salina.1